MKKILSIICALSILMSVLIIPSAFSISAEDTATTPEIGVETVLIPSATKGITVTETDGETIYAEDGSWGGHVLTFDYEIESGYSYILEFDYIGNLFSGASYTQPLHATTVAAATDVVNGVDRDKTLIGSVQSTEWVADKKVALSGDDLLESGGKYLSLFWWCIEGTTPQFKNISITKYNGSGKILYPSATKWVDLSVVNNEIVAAETTDYGAQSMTFDYVIEADKEYLLTFDYYGATSAPGGYGVPFSATTVAKAYDAVKSKPADYTTLNGSLPNKTSWTNNACVILNGNDLLENGGQYLALFHIFNEGTELQLKNIKISEFTMPSDVLMPSYLHNTSMGAEDGDLIFTSGTWNAGSITFDYQIEEGYDYYLSFQFKGHNYAAAQHPSASTVATATTNLNGTVSSAIKLGVPSSKTAWSSVFVPLDGDALLASGGTYLAINWVHVDPAGNYKNFKIAKVAKSDNIIPSALKNNEMFFGMEGNRVYWYCDVPGESYKNPTFSTNFEIEAGKKYAVNFDYKYTGSMAGGMWFGSTDTTTASSESLITQIQSVNLSSADDWTNTTVFFDTTKTDLITDTSKYFAFRAYSSWGAPKLYFSNLTITEVDADSIYPIAGDKFASQMVDGEVVTTYSATTGADQYDTVGFTTDYVLENNKEYIVAFDYKYNGAWFNDSFRAISTGSAWNEDRLRAGKMVDILNAGEKVEGWTQAVAGFIAATDETNTNLGFAAMAAPNATYELSVKGIKLYENGDVNLDNTIDTSDIALLKKTLIGADAEGAAFTNISLDEENSTNVLDLVKIKKILAEKDTVAE